jgi:hypothetical protein
VPRQYVERILKMTFEPFIIIVQESNELTAACLNS